MGTQHFDCKKDSIEDSRSGSFSQHPFGVGFFTPHPLDLIRHSDEFFEEGVKTGLISLTTWRKIFPVTFSISSPVFAPPCWEPTHDIPDQCEYNSWMASCFPFSPAVLTLDNLAVVGQAAFHMFLPKTAGRPRHCRLCMFGEKNQWQKIQAILTMLYTLQPLILKSIESIMLYEGKLEIVVKDLEDQSYFITIPLVTYASMSDLLNVQSIGCEAIAFDGSQTYVTLLGAWSLTFKAVILDVSLQQAPEDIHTVFQLGFALVFPCLKNEIFEDRKRSYARVTQEKSEKDFVGLVPFTCDVHFSSELVHFGRLYFIEKKQQEEKESLRDVTLILKHNINVLIRREGTYMYSLQRNWKQILTNFEQQEQTIDRLIPEHEFYRYLNSLETIHITKTGKSNLFEISDFYRFSWEDIVHILGTVYQHRKSGTEQQFRLQMEKRTSQIKQRYAQVNGVSVEWWRSSATHREKSALSNSAAYEKWYPVEYISQLPEKTCVVTGANITTARSTSEVDFCCICQSSVQRRSSNTIVMPCNHIFHLMSSSECQGIWEWLREHECCPYCKTDREFSVVVPGRLTHVIEMK
jgi:hypothetical protein